MFHRNRSVFKVFYLSLSTLSCFDIRIDHHKSHHRDHDDDVNNDDPNSFHNDKMQKTLNCFSENNNDLFVVIMIPQLMT